jgi:hypothetical protein
MSHAKRVSTRKRRGKAMPALGAAGLLALASWRVRRDTRGHVDVKYRSEPPSLFG